MAKRRNLKKEKAERNQAYARQFRQKSSRYSSRNQRFGNNQKKRDDEQTSSDKN